MDLEFFLFFGPKNEDVIGYNIFTLHPTSFLMPYLNSSWNFFQKMYTFDMVGPTFLKLNCLEGREVRNFQNRVT